MIESNCSTGYAERKEDCKFTKAVRKRGRRPRNSLSQIHESAGTTRESMQSPHTQSASPQGTIFSSGASTQEGLSAGLPLDRRPYGVDTSATETQRFLTSPSDAEKMTRHSQVFLNQENVMNGRFQTPASNVSLEPPHNAISPTQVGILPSGFCLGIETASILSC